MSSSRSAYLGQVRAGPGNRAGQCQRAAVDANGRAAA